MIAPYVAPRDGRVRPTEHATRPLRITLSVGASLGLLGMGNGGYKLARALSEAGADVSVVCAGAASGTTDWRTTVVDLHPVMRVVPWTPLRAHSGYALALRNNYFDWRASRLVGNPDVLYAYSDQALFSVRAARSKGARTVLHAANTHAANLERLLREEHRRVGQSQRLITSWMVRKIVREYGEVDVIRTQSSLVRETLLSRGVPERKVVHIPPSVDLDLFRPSLPETGPFTVSFVGSFDLRKGIPYLLRAIDVVARPDVRFILHGGSGSRFMNRLLAPYRRRRDVEFRSGDPRPTYHESSVCVVPSVEDGFAYVVLEALACGVPVIVTDGVGGKDAIVDGENGFVVPIRDPWAIAERVGYLYDNPSVAGRLRLRAREAAERYTFAREGRALMALFSRMTGQA